MQSTFPGEGNVVRAGSVGSRAHDRANRTNTNTTMNRLSPPESEHDKQTEARGYFGRRNKNAVLAWMEVWDYVGGSSFRGFVVGDTLFFFFQNGDVGRELKQGYVNFLAFCSVTRLGRSWVFVE